MQSLLISVLEAAFAIFIVSAILLAAYGVSLRATRSISRRSEEKGKPFACGEDVPPLKTSIPDVHMYSVVWRRVFKSLYNSLRDRLHTGVLSDWLFWMFLFAVILVIVLVMVVV